ncbi:hypothetical protein E5Q62_04410 [Klebsiella oxytoca]|nr:hypothetical protein [Klebsiella oxytoca]MBZ7305527.1 hypothetical protein [Klebsiella oxytoca]TGN47398.1 hypothetical protein E5Q62_04410 [Klebsiella oxytoca]
MNSSARPSIPWAFSCGVLVSKAGFKKLWALIISLARMAGSLRVYIGYTTRPLASMGSLRNSAC